MTNLSKNGNRQTALDLGDQFDEAAYRAELIAAGIEPAAAADVASKTAQARGKRDRSLLAVGAELATSDRAHPGEGDFDPGDAASQCGSLPQGDLSLPYTPRQLQASGL